MTSNETRRLKAASEFITKASNIHNNKYDYSLVEYINSQSKVTIICPEHGSWEQKPNNHITGYGCPTCADVERGKNKTIKAASEFTTKATLIHNNKYSYELVEYQNSNTKVKILCPVHDVFEQRPNDHLNGKGCLRCAQEESGFTRSKFADKCIKNNNGLGILYILECFNDNERFFKIGITSRSVKERYCSQVSMPYTYRIIDEVIGDPVYIYDLEIKLHQINKQHQYVPEISFGGHATECFKEYRVN